MFKAINNLYHRLTHRYNNNSEVATDIYEKNTNISRLDEAKKYLATSEEQLKHLQFDRSNSKSLLGCGAFGRVVVGKFYQEKVAVKLMVSRNTLHSYLNDNIPDTHDKAIVDEIFTLAKLNHCDFIVNMLCAFEIANATRNGKLMYAMVLEHADCDLYDYLQKRFSENDFLTSREFKYIMLNVFKAIEELHKLEISHNDIKLDNFLVFLSPVNKVKISDFGISSDSKSYEHMMGKFGSLMANLIAGNEFEKNNENAKDQNTLITIMSKSSYQDLFTELEHNYFKNKNSSKKVYNPTKREFIAFYTVYQQELAKKLGCPEFLFLSYSIASFLQAGLSSFSTKIVINVVKTPSPAEAMANFNCGFPPEPLKNLDL